MMHPTVDIKTFFKPGTRVHLAGIGGVSMCPLAEVLAGMGLQVQGSDMSESDTVRQLRAQGIPVAVGHSAENLKDCAVLRNDYGVDSSLSDSDARLIVGVRYGLELSSIQDVKYTFASDVSVELISQVVDGEFKGVTAGTSSVRVYNTTHAAHILGYIGSIWSEEWNSDESTGYVGYKDKGYSMNDVARRPHREW